MKTKAAKRNTRQGIDPIKGSSLAFFAATLVFLLTYSAAAAPIPLYSIYQQSIGISDTVVSLTMFTNLVGVMASLAFAGSISDAIGRKPVVIFGLICGILGSIMFLTLANPAMLLFARFVQGLGNGVAMSAVAAYVVDAAGERYGRYTAMVASAAPYLGLGIGSVISGIVTTFGLNPAIAFACLTIVLVIGLAIVAISPESIVDRKPLKGSLSLPIHIPTQARKVFPLVAIAYSGAWLMGVYYQSFSALVATNSFLATGTLIGAFILILANAPNMFGGGIEVRLPQEKSLSIGGIAFIASTILCCITMWLHFLPGFLLATAMYSLSNGVTLSACMREMINGSGGSSSASAISALNMVAYISCTLISMVQSALIAPLGLLGTLVATTAICSICLIISMILFARRR